MVELLQDAYAFSTSFTVKGSSDTEMTDESAHKKITHSKSEEEILISKYAIDFKLVNTFF